MTPTTALKYISKVKKHIAELELDLVCAEVKPGIDVATINEDLIKLRKLLAQYEDVLKEHKVI